MRNSRQILHVAAAVASLGFAASCGSGSGGASDTLPADWTGAQALTIEQSQCKGSADGTTATSTLDVTDTGGMLAVAITNLSFRCQQSLCAYVTDRGATTRVLLQPCDLHPTNVVRCDCWYDVTFTLPARADRTAVEVYKRFDFYGATTPPTPTLAATAPVGAAALHWYKTCGDPVCFVGDGGASAADGGIAACTTEKVGDACATSGATCDPGDGCNVHLLCADKDPRVQTGGCPISRRAAKRDIAYLDDTAIDDLAARLRAVRLARYRYKDAPEKERLGLVIDDGQGGPAVDERRDQIDLYGYLSWTVAALQAEMKRADVQERESARVRREIALLLVGKQRAAQASGSEADFNLQSGWLGRVGA
jgi:hypothetical protein